MFVQRRQYGVLIQAPAKLNLFFEVLARRADGFHEIETLMCPISLFDTLVCRPNPEGAFSLSVHAGAGDGASLLEDVPSDGRNLALRAVLALRAASGTQQGADLSLCKRIPSAAGLGGGSSDAAAALVAANLAWGLDWPRARLAELAAPLGSDVPFFLEGGMAVCRGRGERLAPVEGGGHLHFVVVRPAEGLSTAAVYGRCTPAAQPRSVEPLLSDLRAGRDPSGSLHNQLEPAAGELSAWIGRLRQAFAGVGCHARQMSGSGSSYFGIFPTARAALSAANRLRSQGLGQVSKTRSAVSRSVP